MKEVRTIRLRRGPRLFAVLPTMLTLGNVVCGFGALTFAAKVGTENFGLGGDDDGCLYYAGVLIFVAMVFDMLDGRAARWAKQTSQFGAELDSLCDAVSFGVAPAFILIKFSPDFHPRLLWSIAVFYVVCAILRLARFNVETDEADSHEFFSGLPSPAAAGAVASFMVAFPLIDQTAKATLGEGADLWDRWGHASAVWLAPALRVLMPLVTLTTAGLMVSRIRYSHFFNRWFRGRKSYQHVLMLLAGIFIAVMVKELALPVIFCGFAFAAPIRAGLDWMLGKKTKLASAGPATTVTDSDPEASGENLRVAPPQ